MFKYGQFLWMTKPINNQYYDVKDLLYWINIEREPVKQLMDSMKLSKWTAKTNQIQMIQIIIVIAVLVLVVPMIQCRLIYVFEKIH